MSKQGSPLRLHWLLRSAALGLLISSHAEMSHARVPRRPPEDPLLAQRERVIAASVSVPARSCAGSVAMSPRHVLTAAHCIPENRERLSVVLRNGRRILASVDYLDRDADLAVLLLDESARVEPLAIADELPQVGDRLLFVGRVDRKLRPRVARVVRLSQCPSLPGVDRAVFTTLQAKPGDSGAPLVSASLEIVGVVHGGAACHIAAPTVGLTSVLEPTQPEAV